MVSRRALLAAGLAAGAVTLGGCAPDRSEQSARAEVTTPPTTPPPARRLAAGTDARIVDVLTRYLGPTVANPNHPTYAGAVALVSLNGHVEAHEAVGHALRYGAGPVELPPDDRVAMRPDSVFDLASLTKVYTAILTLQLVDEGRLDLDAPVAEYLPAFGKPALTSSLLLAHTSGLPVGANVAGLGSNAARRAAVLSTPLLDGAVPGQAFRYSSVGLMVLGQLVEEITGQRLDQALRTRVTGPMGLTTTGFNPKTWMSTEDISARMVATDARSPAFVASSTTMSPTRSGYRRTRRPLRDCGRCCAIGQSCSTAASTGVRLLSDKNGRACQWNVVCQPSTRWAARLTTGSASS
jgi:CubicO group peptidase (beta-lactamase class C family)